MISDWLFTPSVAAEMLLAVHGMKLHKKTAGKGACISFDSVLNRIYNLSHDQKCLSRLCQGVGKKEAF